MPPDSPAREWKLSWSRLKELESCRALGWLRYQKKVKELRDSRVFFPGTVVDRVMRDWLSAEEQVPGAMPGLVDSVFDREEAAAPANGDGVVRWKTISDRDNVREKCRECARRLEPILLEHVVPFEYQVAARFTVPVQVPYHGQPRELLLTGEMDLLVRRPEGLGVDDLKMTENDDYWKQTYPQLIFYGIACAAMQLGWPVSYSLIQPMCKQPRLPFAFAQEHYAEMFSRIVRAAEYWWDGDHRPKADNNGCHYCLAFAACPKFVRSGNRRLMSAYPVTAA